MLYAVFTFEYQNIRETPDLISKVSKGFEIKLPKLSAILMKTENVFLVTLKYPVLLRLPYFQASFSLLQ